MYTVFLTWSEFKNELIAKGFPLNYKEFRDGYEVFIVDRQILWTTNLTSTIEKLDFETYYKSKCNKYVNPLSEDGKEFVRTESRPLLMTTVFVGQGDGTSIANGKKLLWDFSNTEDLVDAPTGYKRKKLEFRFIDPIYVKEGTLYYFNVLKGSICDMYVVCPAGQYYLSNNSVPRLASIDTSIAHYVVSHPLQGSIPMGDELNTEACSTQILANYKFWIDITVPEADNESNGAISIKIYRLRTEVLA